MESMTGDGQQEVILGSKAIECTESLTSMQQAYKKLLVDVAAELLPEDIEKLAFMQELPAVQNQTGLDLLRTLDKHGKIGQFKIAELERMLTDAHRSDLVTSKISLFRQKYHSPGKGERRRHRSDVTYHRTSHSPLSSEKRSNTLPAFESVANKTDPTTNDNLSSVIQQETEEPNTNQRPVTSTPVTGRHTPASMSSHYSSQSTNDHMFNPYADSSSSYSGFMGVGVAPHQPRKQCSQTTSYSDLSIGGGSSAAEMSGYLHNAKLFSPSQHTQEDILGPAGASPLQHEAGYYMNDPYLPRSMSAVQQGFPVVMMSPYSVFHPPIRRSFTPPGCVPLQREKALQSPLTSTEQFSLPAKNVCYNSRTGHVVTRTSLSMSNSPTSHTNFLPEFSSEAPLSSELLTTSSSPTIHKPRKKQMSKSAATASTSQQLSQQPDSLENPMSDGSSQSSRSSGDDSQSQEHKSDFSLSAEHSAKFEGSGAYGQNEPSSATVNESLQVKGGILRSKLKLRRQSKHKELRWQVKRDKLNKAIYKHKENRTFECKKKLEVDIGVGSGFNPKLTLFLHPYGLEEDREQNVTLTVNISASKKAPPLKHSAAKAILLLRVSEKYGDKELLYETCREIDLNLRVYTWNGIITHEALRKSRSESIIIELQVAKED